MIFKRMWRKTKRKGYLRVKSTHYVGWFLFGIIPLYIKTIKVEYYR